MVQNREETEYEPGLSGMGGRSYKVDHISGWILNFFAYWTYGDGDYERFDLEHLGVKDFKKFPSQISKMDLIR